MDMYIYTKSIFVFDLGGDTYGRTILQLRNGSSSVLAICRDGKLGRNNYGDTRIRLVGRIIIPEFTLPKFMGQGFEDNIGYI